ncbi:MAG: hypothetical protein MUE85_06630 [Microscillaceae bacterium]|jgi:hypothetical protein|nr:hypothetical protein [Microscillaceae bacterium]
MENIIIQTVNENNLTLNVNGEIQQIQNELTDLKELLKNRQVQNIQYADKIYNIAHINEANFGLLTGKQAFNEILTRKLIEAIQPYSVDAKILLDYMTKQQISDWASQEKYAKKAKEILAYSFVGVIGMQISHLIGIGNNKNLKAEDKIVPYIEKCLYLARYSLDLLGFALVSKLWDIQKNQTIQLTPSQTDHLQAFFGRRFEPDLLEQLAFMQALHAAFMRNQLPLPLPELQNWQSQWTNESTFYQACQKLQKLKKLASDKYTFVECAEAEAVLSQLMAELSFLANYKMASIKKVGYKYLRNTDPHFIHNYIQLGFDQKANPDIEKYRYTREDIATDTVLIYQGDNYATSLNLFPFVIDYNALTFEQGPKIYFYQSLDFKDKNTLEYILLKDDEVKSLDFQDILHQPNLDWNELVGNAEKLKSLNLDHVILQFRAAEAGLLAQAQSDTEFDNLFNQNQ